MAANSGRDKMKLGVFLAVTLVVALGVLVSLVGVSLMESTRDYTVYFEQSVTGLSVGSQVTLNGVRVGEVRSIKVDPQNVERIKVEVAVDDEIPVKVDTKAFLSSQGITGLKYIDLEESTNAAALLPDGSEIPVGKGLLDRLTDSAEEVTHSTEDITAHIAYLTREENLKRIDNILVQSDEFMTNANMLSQELSKTLVVTRELMERNEKEIDRTIKNVSVASGELDGVMRETRLTLKMGREKLEEADVAALLNGVSQTNDVLRTKIDAIDVRSVVETLATLQVLVVELAKSVGQNQEQLRVMLYNMRQTSDNLKDLSREVRDRPSSLVFDRAPKEREVPDGR